MTEQLLILPNGLKMHLYYWGNLNNMSKINLCIPGLPNYPDKEFFKTLPKPLHNQAFFVLYYYGYWFSSGDFNVKNTASSIVDAVQALRSGKFKDAFTNASLRPFNQKINLIGYSFGANPLARAIKDIPTDQVGRIYFIAPLALVNNKDLRCVSNEQLRKFHSFNLNFVDFLVRGYSEVVRMSSRSEWDNYFSGNHEDSLVSIPKDLIDKVQVHYGESDTLLSKQLLGPLIDAVDARNIIAYKETGHSKDLIPAALLSNR